MKALHTDCIFNHSTPNILEDFSKYILALYEIWHGQAHAILVLIYKRNINTQHPLMLEAYREVMASLDSNTQTPSIEHVRQLVEAKLLELLCRDSESQ